jgi:hypothetical protein
MSVCEPRLPLRSLFSKYNIYNLLLFLEIANQEAHVCAPSSPPQTAKTDQNFYRFKDVFSKRLIIYGIFALLAFSKNLLAAFA